MDNKDKPAFAAGAMTDSGAGFHETGLTKREYFAALIMQGIMSDVNTQYEMKQDGRFDGKNFSAVVALNSLEFADALLKALECD